MKSLLTSSLVLIALCLLVHSKPQQGKATTEANKSVMPKDKGINLFTI